MHDVLHKFFPIVVNKYINCTNLYFGRTIFLWKHECRLTTIVISPPNSSCLCMSCCFSWVRLCDPMDRSPPSLLCTWDSPGKNSGVGCHALFQGIFLAQGSNLCHSSLLHWQAGSLPLSATWEARIPRPL